MRWIPSAALGAALFLLYLRLAPPVSGDKDASEFALALASSGVTHPTGYPLFTMLGHLFVRTLHALGVGFPFASNAWAALGGGVAMALYHRLALRVLPARAALSPRARFILAAVPVLMLGFNPVWMLEATVVEVHSWQIAWLCGLSLYFAGLVEDLEGRRVPAADFSRRMAAWGFLCGLGGAHHATSIFFAGGLTLALCVALARARRLHPWVPIVWLAAGAVPLTSYAWIYFKAIHPGTAEVWPTLEPSLASVIDHVTARAYRMYVGRWAPDGGQAAWLAWYVHPYLWAGLALYAFRGLGARDFGRRLVAAGLILAAVAQTLFAFRYGVSDPAAYFLPGLAVAFLSLAAAGADLLPWLRRRRFVLAAAGVVALALGFAAVTGAALMEGRRRKIVELDEYLHSMWRAIPYERGIVLWPIDLYYRLKEYQAFRGEKPGLDVYNTASLFNPYPRERFRRRYGFDPLAHVDEEHRRQPLKPEFVIGQQATEELTHASALVHERITQEAGIPVIAFDPPRPTRAWIPKPASPAGAAAAPDSIRPAR